MDFYSQQNKARRYTFILLLYFIVAVILIVAMVNVAIYAFFMFIEFHPHTPADWFSQKLVYYLSGITILVIAGGSFLRWQKLKDGGHSVAEMVGAEPLALNSTDARERQFINVVEEMSIASGVPLPDLYVMRNEPGINAFVAGYQPAEAVMVVTNGAIQQLNREELQGVVAHEYSHILNGDMRINIRMISVLAGIVMISLAGRFLLRGGSHSSSARGASAILILGFFLLTVGYIGVLTGRMIKAAVSRQREYLADAAAVQFTRNPRGIASALDTIRLSTHQSALRNLHAEDMSHMCFAHALTHRFTSWMATHPPLMERIRQIDPSYIARIKARDLTDKISQEKNQKTDERVTGFTPLSAHDVAFSAGDIQPSHIIYASLMHESFGERVLASAHEKNSARLIVYALIIAKMDQQTGVESVDSMLNADEKVLLKELLNELGRLGDNARLPLFDLLVPVLKKMQKDEKLDFINTCKRIIKSDSRYTLHEFVLLSLLEINLFDRKGANQPVKHYTYKAVQDELSLLLSLMIYASKNNASESEAVFDKVSVGFSLQQHRLLERSEIKTGIIKQALLNLSSLTPVLKSNIIEACADIALHDNQLESMEAELLRVIADSLGCPVPPLSCRKQ